MFGGSCRSIIRAALKAEEDGEYEEAERLNDLAANCFKNLFWANT
jgi:cellobiose-specific phosphotransferase system component IIA